MPADREANFSETASSVSNSWYGERNWRCMDDTDCGGLSERASHWQFSVMTYNILADNYVSACFAPTAGFTPHSPYSKSQPSRILFPPVFPFRTHRLTWVLVSMTTEVHGYVPNVGRGQLFFTPTRTLGDAFYRLLSSCALRRAWPFGPHFSQWLYRDVPKFALGWQYRKEQLVKEIVPLVSGSDKAL
eukprot:gene20511-27301_t